MLRTNFLKQKLGAGKTVIGSWSVIPSVVAADIAAASGLDFLIIDREHGPASFETAQAMIASCESRGVSPLLRVGGPEAPDILRAMESGAHGLHIPNIRSVGEIQKALAYCKYPPLGERGFSPFTRACGYSHLNSKKMQSLANQAVLLAVHIEGPGAVEALDEMLEIKEIDIFFIGLFDLSKSLGIPGQIDHPRLTHFVKKLCTRIRKAGKVPGSIATNERQLKSAVAQGVRYITYSADAEILLHGYRAVRDYFKRLI